jgi:TonB family protein
MKFAVSGSPIFLLFGSIHMKTTTDSATPTFFLLLSVLCIATVSGCASPDFKLDPFGRPIDESNSITPGPLDGCSKADFDEPPKLVSGVRPIYPVGRRVAGQSGSAFVRFTVRADGRIEDIKTVGPEATWFSDHAIIALREWKIEPALKAKKPVETTCKFAFHYKLI